MGRIYPKNANAQDPRYTGGDAIPTVQNILNSLPYIVFVNNDLVPWSVVLTGKTGFTTTYTLNPGMILSWPTAPYVSFTAALPTNGIATNFQYLLFSDPVQRSTNRDLQRWIVLS